MATLAINPQLGQQPKAQSQEPTKDAPASHPKEGQYADLIQRYGPELLRIIREKRDSWSPKRQGILREVITNKEFLKGNQQIGFFPGTTETFDSVVQFNALNQGLTGQGLPSKKTEDRSIFKHCTNLYQMVEAAFVAAMSADIPKVQFEPADADREADQMMAKASSRVQRIIERFNKVRQMVEQELMEIFTGGCYFKHTRYVVDGAKTGTHKETVLETTAAEILPARYQCFNCGTITPESDVVAQKQLSCPNCGAPLGEKNYLEDYSDQVPVAKEKDVANGMVLQSVYGAIHVDADPAAADLTGTMLLNISEEVPVGWLRKTFPKHWNLFRRGNTEGTGTNESQERQYRDMLTSPAVYFGNSNSRSYAASTDRPTYQRTWCQVDLFYEIDKPEIAQALEAAFPNGCMIAHLDDHILQIRPAKLTDEWTWCGSIHRGYGLYPPPVGKPAVSVQMRINDAANIIHEWLDRLACGILIANERYLDTQALNGKPLLPGILNGVAFKRDAPMSSISELIFQVKAEISNAVMPYYQELKHEIELLVGTPPQLFGGPGDPHIETKGGQQQQKDQGLAKLGLYWNGLRIEHAEAAENGVMCAGRNMTEDWKSTVTGETKEYQSEYVKLAEMKGTVKAEPEADQNFPMTYAEIRNFFQQLMQAGDQQLMQWLVSEPSNVEVIMRYIGPPGLVAPGGAVKTKVLRVIDQLMKSEPVQSQGPMGPILLPAVQPDKVLDGPNLAAIQKVLISWSADHWDTMEEKPSGKANVKLYYQMCVQFEAELAMEKQKRMAALMPPPQQGKPQQQPEMSAT